MLKDGCHHLHHLFDHCCHHVFHHRLKLFHHFSGLLVLFCHYCIKLGFLGGKKLLCMVLLVVGDMFDHVGIGHCVVGKQRADSAFRDLGIAGSGCSCVIGVLRFAVCLLAISA